jgi:hypothetical protein
MHMKLICCCNFSFTQCAWHFTYNDLNNFGNLFIN